MRWSELFVPTLREVPAEAEAASHQLLLRAGFIRQLGAGIYSYLPLARRTLLKIEQIIREEMNAIGGQEFYLPALHPAEIWKESGRWDEMGENLFRFKDRGQREMCLGMTHEEIFTTIARSEIRSYRDLPQVWYQIQVKFRDEPRPKSGLLRTRQFTMKDSYSFDLEEQGLDANYRLHHGAYCSIFDRCGLRYRVVAAESGAMGGSESEEFMVESEAGEDVIVSCSCGYAANLERAASAIPAIEDEEMAEGPQEIHTPDRKTIQEVSEFLKISTQSQIKSLVYQVEGQLQLVLLRGDHQLNESHLSRVLGTDKLRPATAAEIREAFGADPGSLGPVGIGELPILADRALEGRRNLVCGANRDDYHLRGVMPGRDFQAGSYHLLRQVEAGDPCLDCGQALQVTKTLEVGHIFKLGDKYSKSMGATVLTQQGTNLPIVMGSYGIGLERIMVAAVELYHDSRGIVWPHSIAPFAAVITVVRPDDPEQSKAAQDYYQALRNQGVDCLLDDRDERPGVKFKDAELIGIPVRLTVGRKFSEGLVELYCRHQDSTREVAVDQAVEETQAALKDYPL